MNDALGKILLDELRDMRGVVDGIRDTVNGERRRVDKLGFEVKLARWVIGVMFSAVSLALAEHWLGK